MDPALLKYKLRVKEYYEAMGLSYLQLYLSESVKDYEDVVMWLRGARVLDVGCGLGIGASMASGVARQYVCLDIACGLLRYPSVLPYVDVVCSDGASMPIRDYSMEYVLAINVINAEGDGYLILREAMRVGRNILAKSPRAMDNELIHKVLVGKRDQPNYDDSIIVIPPYPPRDH